AYVAQDFDAATFAIDRAVALNGNLANAWFASGCLRYWLGDSEGAIDHISHFKGMSPLNPLIPVARSAAAFAHIFRNQYEDALSEAKAALREAPSLHFALRAFAT